MDTYSTGWKFSQNGWFRGTFGFGMPPPKANLKTRRTEMHMEAVLLFRKAYEKWRRGGYTENVVPADESRIVGQP